MSDPAAQIALIVNALQRSQVSRYSIIASACLFIYDYFVTLPDEIQLVWPGPWGPGKIIFLLTRYITWPEIVLSISHQTSDLPASQCHSYFVYFVWSTLWGLAASELILILRTWALWNRKKVVGYGLVILLISLWIPGSYIVNTVNNKTIFLASSSLSPALRGCFLTSSSSLLPVSWIILMTMDATVFTLTVVRGLYFFRYRSSSLLRSLYRDGVLYFTYLFALSAATVVVLYTAAPEYTILLTQSLRVLHAILSCRIILGLRATAMQRENLLLSTTGPQRPTPAASTVAGSTWFGGGDEATMGRS